MIDSLLEPSTIAQCASFGDNMSQNETCGKMQSDVGRGQREESRLASFITAWRYGILHDRRQVTGIEINSFGFHPIDFVLQFPHG